jgi:hypothetical protein
MGFREIFARSVQMFKDEFDLEQELGGRTLASQYIEIKHEMETLRDVLEETRAARQERDELIARLQARDAIKDGMILDGSAYFLQKSPGVLEGPFCTCCFDQRQQMVRLVPASKPQGGTGRASDWVQCLQCATPFPSRRAGEFLRGHDPAAAADTEETTPTSKSQDAPKRSNRSRRRPPSE